MNALVFENFVPIDPRSWSIMGLSAKETNSPIGKFGTGLKYAIAIVLRTGGEITIYSKGERYRFTAEDTEFRGQAFKQIRCNNDLLPFTLDYGKHWKPWQGFRELYCNCIDEEGIVRVLPADNVKPNGVGTTIIVTGEEMLDAYNMRHAYFLDTNKEPLARSPKGEVYEGSGIYLKGVKVSPETFTSRFAYNFKQLDISEDRQCSVGWGLQYATAKLVSELKDPVAMERIYKHKRDRNSFEDDCDWCLHNNNTVMSVMEEMYKRNPLSLNPKCRKTFRANRPDAAMQPYKPTPEEMANWTKALDDFHALGFTTLPHKFVELEGQFLLGGVVENEVFITQRGLRQGHRDLLALMYEEFVFHAQHQYPDMDRVGQTFLINEIIRLKQELQKK